MSRSGLSPGRSGNVSARLGDGFLITPTGLAYDALSARDMVLVDADGQAEAGSWKPSSEWAMHRSIYQRRLDCHAIVHTHSLNAVVLACAREAIPAFHYMVAVAGGPDIPCVPYATFGTVELAALVADGLAERNACLLANHGQVAIADTPAAALELASDVETLAEQYLKVRLLGRVNLLDAEEMARVGERFRSYGQAGVGRVVTPR